MEVSVSCQKCGHNIPNQPTYYFCSNCAIQVRCKNCKEYLEKEAKACSSCGTRIVDNHNNIAVNNIEFEQKGDSKRFKANFTDVVGENLMHSLNGLFLGTYRGGPNQNPFTNTAKIPSTAAVNQPAKKELQFDYAQEVSEDTEDINAVLVKVFKNDNEELSLINQRLKYTGKRDHAIRIALVALYAYSVLGKQQVSRNTINKMLQAAAVFDRNYLTWLSKCDEIKKVDSDLIELNLPGRDAAIEILKEFLNPAVTKGSVNFSALGGGKRAKGKKTKGEGDATEGLSVKNSHKSSSMSPAKMIDILIGEKYFTEKRRIADIIKHCKDNKGQSLDVSTLGVALLRKVKSQNIKREENIIDKQYEYFQ